MKATKRPLTIDFFPLERQYVKEIMKWSTIDKPIDITVPKSGPIEAKIETLEGTMIAHEGKDVIIKGIDNEVYPHKISIFQKAYNVL